MSLIIDRKYYHDCTVGRLTFEDFQCFTLELPNLANEPNISCIPPGTYEAFKRVSPSRGAQVLELKDVIGRSYIQIHPGNYTRQIKGCILPGDGVKWLDADKVPDVTNSGATFKKLLSLLPDEFELLIK